jgi:predicted CXXCH cytochrome family protein
MLAAVLLAVAAASVAPAQSDPAGPPAATPVSSATAPAPPASTFAKDACVTCHLDNETAEAVAYRSDIHYARGVSCADCHGGDRSNDDQDAAMSKAKGFIGVPRKQDIPRVCGACHGPGQGAFKSRHRLEDVLTGFRGGIHGHSLDANANGPQCVSCHGVHGIQRVTDARSPVHPSRVVDTCARCHGNAAYMRDFDPTVPVDQKEKYLTSVHGKRHAAGDAKVATCVSCHSNHLVLQAKDPRSPVYPTRIPATCGRCHSDAKYMAGYGIPTTQYADYKESVHGQALLKKSDLNAPACNSCHGNHGAAPPGVASVIAVCGQCHQSNEELYEKSVHRALFEKQKLAGCVVCHGNHRVVKPTDSVVSFDAVSPCGKCHKNDGTDKDAAGIVRLKGLLDSLSTGQQEAVAALDHAENLGMDVADARYSLKDVNQSVVQSRVAIHTFRTKDLEEAARPGIALIAQAKQAGHEAVREYHFRRQGLAISTLIVTFVVVLLWLKIRQIERRQRNENR